MNPDEEVETLCARLAQRPDDTKTRLVLARLYLGRQRPDLALALLDEVPDDPAPILKCLALAGSGRPQEALRMAEDAADKTDEPLMMHTLAYWLNQNSRWASASRLLRSGLCLEPDNAGMHHDLAIALMGIGDPGSALHHFEIARKHDPANPHLAFNTALALEQEGRLEQARARIAEVRTMMPQHLGALYREVYLDRLMCRWSDVDGYRSRLSIAFREHIEKHGQELISPYGLNIYDVEPAVHDSAAAYYAVQIQSLSGAVVPQRKTGDATKHAGSRIRLGYLSPDFHSHAVGGLISGMFACHDRSRFDVFAYSLTERHDAIREEIVAGVDQYRDLTNHGNDQAAAAIAGDGIDILIDLGGYTRRARPQILALRPAQRQVSFLGYLNTMQAPFIDALIADDVVVPQKEEPDYSEKILRLPRCFLPVTPRTRPPAARRSDLGLPGDAFVFSCFNHSYKVDPDCFSAWCRILDQVSGSVLWLLADRDVTRRNLLAEAADRNIDTGRIRFAGRVPLQEHLARMQAADLFLDTRVYNAGATAIAAVQAGLPVLSLSGPRILGRMSTSLNHHLGLEELICDNPDQYVATAIELASSGSRLPALRTQLADAFERNFAIADYCRDLEVCLEEWLKDAAVNAGHQR